MLVFTPGLFTAQPGKDQKANILRLSLLRLFNKVPSQPLLICCGASTHISLQDRKGQSSEGGGHQTPRVKLVQQVLVTQRRSHHAHTNPDSRFTLLVLEP